MDKIRILINNISFIKYFVHNNYHSSFKSILLYKKKLTIKILY